LLPQIVYYFSSYAKLRHEGKIAKGEKVNFCVPTGNFGDILAGYYAKRMGLPVNKLICASNSNNVLTDFFKTGEYCDNRPFYKTMSCSIDILISSNLERLLFELADRDCDKVKAWMSALSTENRYMIAENMRETLAEDFDADWCSEEETLQTIKHVFELQHYLMDPHTAVAQAVYEGYVRRTGDTTHTILLSTANPYKFASDVLSAFEDPSEDDFENAERLHGLSGVKIPKGLSELLGKPELHTDVCDLVDMKHRTIQSVQ